jgi:hypothetical protein
MNSVPVRSARLSERAAYHEAGHCAAAIAFGIPIIGVIVEGDAGHLYRGFSYFWKRVFGPSQMRVPLYPQ